MPAMRVRMGVSRRPLLAVLVTIAMVVAAVAAASPHAESKNYLRVGFLDSFYPAAYERELLAKPLKNESGSVFTHIIKKIRLRPNAFMNTKTAGTLHDDAVPESLNPAFHKRFITQLAHKNSAKFIMGLDEAAVDVILHMFENVCKISLTAIIRAKLYVASLLDFARECGFAGVHVQLKANHLESDSDCNAIQMFANEVREYNLEFSCSLPVGIRQSNDSHHFHNVKDLLGIAAFVVLIDKDEQTLDQHIFENMKRPVKLPHKMLGEVHALHAVHELRKLKVDSHKLVIYASNVMAARDSTTAEFAISHGLFCELVDHMTKTTPEEWVEVPHLNFRFGDKAIIKNAPKKLEILLNHIKDKKAEHVGGFATMVDYDMRCNTSHPLEQSMIMRELCTYGPDHFENHPSEQKKEETGGDTEPESTKTISKSQKKGKSKRNSRKSNAPQNT